MTPTENHNCYFDCVSNFYFHEYSDIYDELILLQLRLLRRLLLLRLLRDFSDSLDGYYDSYSNFFHLLSLFNLATLTAGPVLTATRCS